VAVAVAEHGGSAIALWSRLLLRCGGNEGEVGAAKGVEWSRVSGARLRRAHASRGPPGCHPYAVTGDRPPRGGRGLTQSSVGAARAG
jgi:hypothetical protein